MTHAADLGLLAVLASWVLHVLLGAWVLTLTPRRRQTLLLGGYFVLHGLGHTVAELATVFDLVGGALVDPSRHLVQDLGSALESLGHVAILLLALSVPSRLEDRRLLGTSLAVGGGFSAFTVVGNQVGFPVGLSPRLVVAIVDLGIFWATAVLLALRAAPSREPTAEETTQLAILALAFAFISTFTNGAALQQVAEGLVLEEPSTLMASLGLLGIWMTVAAIWGRNMVEAGPDTVRIHRAAMLSILGLFLAGAAGLAAGLATTVAGRIILAGVNVLGLALLAYGILRHDLVGLDAKVEYGLSKTTVAGVFVAVFFVAGELAETFFGEVFGPYAGIIAAGALVFVISPLQQVADRFAARAVPGGAEAGQGAEASYREAVELALTDGEITPDEETRLAGLADRLGVPSRRALEIRREVEDRADGGGERA